MGNCIRRLLSAVIVAAFSVSGASMAADAELRTFSVTVDGKPAGTFKMAVRLEDNGTETIAVVADVKVKAGLFSYTYEHQCLEVWKNGLLVSVDANTNDDGKRYKVKAVMIDGQLSITVNGKESTGHPGVLTSSGWRFPGPVDKIREVTFFDAEDGTETAAKIEPLAIVKLYVNGKVVETQPFHITGKDLDTLWSYDANRRPVRQEMKWDGHKVVLELTDITR